MHAYCIHISAVVAFRFSEYIIIIIVYLPLKQERWSEIKSKSSLIQIWLLIWQFNRRYKLSTVIKFGKYSLHIFLRIQADAHSYRVGGGLYSIYTKILDFWSEKTLQRLVVQGWNGGDSIKHLYYYVLERRGGGECA